MISPLPKPKSLLYLNRYIKLIDYVLSNPNTFGYTENHHILPKSMGGSNKKENLIKFTARQHFLAHWMLWKAYDSPQMLSAFWLMRHAKDKNQTKRYQKLNSVVYEKLKLEKSIKLSQRMTGKNNYWYGKRSTNYGKPMSIEQKQKISNANKGKVGNNRGKRFSIETRKRISNSLKNGITIRKVSCVICRYYTISSNLERHQNGAKCIKERNL